MRTLKPMIKKSNKQDRERKILLGLIEHFLKTGKPVGSNTLKECGFEDLSSATIRNYFANLEGEGYLQQQHTSGGRIPTNKAYRLYADHCFNHASHASKQQTTTFSNLRTCETREITAFLQHATEQLVDITQCAAFLSAPRFDQDFIIGSKFVAIDHARYLCVLITDFGAVLTETLYSSHKLSHFSLKRIEEYCQWRITGIGNKPEHLTKEEEEIALSFYNELMVRYIVNYSNFTHQDIYRTGFSQLLHYPEFQEASLLANSLALFENTHGMRLLLKECRTLDTLKYWIGDDLITYSPYAQPNCTVLAIPYHVNKQAVGAVGLLGPTRMPYDQLFTILSHFSENISEALTNNLYKFKITMRQPKPDELDNKRHDTPLISQTPHLLIENKKK